MEAIIDTNVIIFDLFTDSEFHNEASVLMNSLEKWLIPPIVIHELIWFFRGHGLEDRIDYAIQYIINDKAEILCECGDKILNAINLMRTAGIKNYNDMVILAHALAENKPLATFDTKLARLAKKMGIATLPK